MTFAPSSPCSSARTRPTRPELPVRRALRDPGGSVQAEAVELAVPDAADEGVPLVRREPQDRSGRVPAVADADLAAAQVRHLDAVAVGEAERAFDPGVNFRSPYRAASHHWGSHDVPSLT